MRQKQIPILLGLLLVWMFSPHAEDVLRPRAFLGMAYRTLTTAEVGSLKLQEKSGLAVRGVLPDAPAERAGIKVGDILRRFDTHVITDESRLKEILRSYYAGDALTVELLREGRPLTIRVVASARPEERSDEVTLEYTAFPAKSARLRAVVTSPLASQDRKLPAVLIVSALISPQLIGASFYSADRSLAYAMAKAGYRALRFELRGCGDSEGEDYRNTDFSTEVDDNLAAIDYLKSRSDVDSNRVFVYGHSTGGMTAAILAGKAKVSGLIASCTIGRTFFERMMDTLRVQGELGGEPAADTDRKIRDYLLFTSAIARGESSQEILRRNPEFASFFNASGRIMDDRNLDYWREQLNLNLAEVYAQVKAPVLIVYGGSDFLTQQVCHERIRDVLIRSGNQDVTLMVIPGLDHAYGQAQDRRASFETYKSGNFKENLEANQRITDWLLRH